MKTNSAPNAPIKLKRMSTSRWSLLHDAGVYLFSRFTVLFNLESVITGGACIGPLGFSKWKNALFVMMILSLCCTLKLARFTGIKATTPTLSPRAAAAMIATGV